MTLILPVYRYLKPVSTVDFNYLGILGVNNYSTRNRILITMLSTNGTETADKLGNIIIFQIYYNNVYEI